jgi:hypothetical protein
MKSVINDYISHEIVRNPALLPLSNKASDPLSVNFGSTNTICAYVRARESGRQGAAHV